MMERGWLLMGYLYSMDVVFLSVHHRLTTDEDSAHTYEN